METKTLKLESLINSWAVRDQNISLVTQDGLTLVSWAHHVTDLCSLPNAIQTANHYLKLKDGDLAICNDPYAGGSITSQITLVTAIQMKGSEDHILLLGTRISTRPRLIFGKTVDEDGLKIPPTPLGSLDAPAEPIIGAIAAHPLAPDDFRHRIEKGVFALRQAKASLLASLETYELDLTRSLYQSFVQDAHEYTQAILSEFPHGHSEVQWTFESGEKLRLKLENTGSRLNLDFTGTTQISNFHLTESHIIGCAVRVLEQISGHAFSVNSGSLLAINLTAPKNSFVASHGSDSTSLGVLVGANMICDIIARALSVMHPKRKTLHSTSAPLALSFQFENRSFFDLLPAGSLATAEKRGEAFVDTWNESGLSPSVEDLESIFPLEILAMKKRTESGGQGDQKGGDGVLKIYRLTEPALFRWFGGFPLRYDTNSNSGLGEPPKIVVRMADTTDNTAETEDIHRSELKGEISLPAGATITVMSRGGHAFLKES